MWWQAAQHTMTEQSKKTVTHDPTPVPPPYSPATPSAPTNPPPAPRGVYPILNITTGQMHIETRPIGRDPPDSRSGTPDSYSLRSMQTEDLDGKCSYTGGTERHWSKDEVPPSDAQCQTSVPKEEPIDKDGPFASREKRSMLNEGREALKQAFGNEEAKITREMERLRAEMEEMAERLKQQSPPPPPSPPPSKPKKPKQPKTSVNIEMDLFGRYEDSPYRRRLTRVDAELEGYWAESENDLEEHDEEAEEPPPNTHPRPSSTHPMQLRQRQNMKGVGQYPLMASGEGFKYRPFGIVDVQALVDKLPPVSEGGNLWLAQLDSLTAGQRLALGDFRAVISRCLTGADVREIEIDAGTDDRSDDMPFTRVSTAVGKAMRAKYPLPNAAAMPKIKWDPKQNPREFLDKSKDIWIKHSGEHPGKPGVQREWYRQAILEGVPEEVKTAMKNNPDMLGCDSHIWEKHLIHHLSKAQETREDEQDNLSELQAQLLKMQIVKTKQELKKTEKSSAKVMVAAQQLGTLDLYPVPHWAPQPPPQPFQPQPQGRGKQGPRGRGGWRQRDGQFAKPTRWAASPNDECRCCKLKGHWARDCPYQQDPGNPYPAGRPRGQYGLPLPCGSDTVPCPIEGEHTTQSVKCQIPVCQAPATTRWGNWEGHGDQHQQ
ncbi:hypothetical protein D5F01_LYC19141 [Larimichthys crocea]|uniref:CCHC-type domain-containing protein n=1 Tax=Larimichthys crocea TaxID=215358 RepID=A0A6G0HR71_LARCR|nr:hypothetical protein D5F01_LYC19141 [Larimichthys crocea]